MKQFRLKSTICLAALISAFSATAADDNGNQPVTLAVFGDWPYSQVLLDTSNLLINSVNSDSQVAWVLHVGDIHSGSMPCTSAGSTGVQSPPIFNPTVPTIPTAYPGWNQGIYSRFQQFNAP